MNTDLPLVVTVDCPRQPTPRRSHLVVRGQIQEDKGVQLGQSPEIHMVIAMTDESQN